MTVALTGCSMVDRAEGSTAKAETAPTGGATGTAGPRRVGLLQKVGPESAVRSLWVEPDGKWDCQDCAGDGVNSTGQLTPEQTQRLQRMAADPRLAKETDQARGYKLSCIDALTSTLLIPPGLTITQQDCPGEERPAVAGEILLLLTQATPAEVKG